MLLFYVPVNGYQQEKDIKMQQSATSATVQNRSVTQVSLSLSVSHCRDTTR